MGQECEHIRRAIDYHGSQQNLAEVIECSQASISLWLHRKRRPNPLHAKRIQISTGGLVKAKALQPEVFD